MAAYGSGQSLKVKSIVAAASYRAGEPLFDQKLEKTFDYSDREDVIYTTILAPKHVHENAPWALDRETLWNAVEARESRKDARLARSLILALPRELTMEENIQLVEGYVAAEFVALGMVADVAVHNKQASDFLENPHCHILLTTREITEDGEWATKKNREWNYMGGVQDWRDAWQQWQNTALEEADSDARIDLRSYERRGINRVPQIHRGPTVQAMLDRGEESYIAQENTKRHHENMIREIADHMPMPSDPENSLQLSDPFHHAEIQAYIEQERAEAEEREAWEIAQIENERDLHTDYDNDRSNY
ncbi:MAG: MobQ family relaxase [Chloroflexota bacterium]